MGDIKGDDFKHSNTSLGRLLAKEFVQISLSVCSMQCTITGWYI